MGDGTLVRFMFTYRYEGFSKVEYDIASTEEISRENRDTRLRQRCFVGKIVRVEMPLPTEASKADLATARREAEKALARDYKAEGLTTFQESQYLRLALRSLLAAYEHAPTQPKGDA